MAESAAKRSSVGKDLTSGPIFKLLLMFAVPMVLANLLQQLYSMVDLMVIGKYVGSTGTVGVSTGGEVADLVAPMAMGFSATGQIYIAQLWGAKDERHIKSTVGTLLTFMMLLSALLGLIAICFSGPILRLINCPAEAFGKARSYMIITALGFPAIFGYNAVCGILRGMGDSQKPLIFIAIATVINIVGDVILVVAFKLDAAGTAIATIASQYGSFIASLVYLYRHEDRFGFRMRLSTMKIDKGELAVLCKLGIPQVIRSSLVRFSLLWVNGNINAYGLTVSATNSIGNKIQKFADVFYSSIDQGAGAMIGQNLGARKHDRAAKTTWAALAMGTAAAAIITLFVWTIPDKLVGIFTGDAAVIEMGVVYLHIMTIHFFASAFVGSSISERFF